MSEETTEYQVKAKSDVRNALAVLKSDAVRGVNREERDFK